MQFDYVSDLHIDHWDRNYETDTGIGIRKHFPMKWEKGRSDILVIAGDISDSIINSIEYLLKIKKHYKKIIFIDGNHEHYFKKGKLLDYHNIMENFYYLKNIYYLPKEEVIIDNCVFVGCCGWWDFDGGNSEIENREIFNRANYEFKELIKKLDKYSNDDNIKEIIIVTHTVPLPRFVRQKEFDHNTNFIKINKLNYPKISRWVFGHSHQKYNFLGCGINYISNPRGRPDDYDREEYNIMTSN